MCPYVQLWTMLTNMMVMMWLMVTMMMLTMRLSSTSRSIAKWSQSIHQELWSLHINLITAAPPCAHDQYDSLEVLGLSGLRSCDPRTRNSKFLKKSQSFLWLTALFKSFAAEAFKPSSSCNMKLRNTTDLLVMIMLTFHQSPCHCSCQWLVAKLSKIL